MKKLIVLTAAMLLPAAARAADPIPLAYKAADSQYRALAVTSALSSNGTPVVSAYKGTDGLYHSTLVTAQTCSLDASGNPLACPVAATQADLANYVPESAVGQANGVSGLDASGNATAPVNTTTGTFSSGLNSGGDVNVTLGHSLIFYDTNGVKRGYAYGANGYLYVYTADNTATVFQGGLGVYYTTPAIFTNTFNVTNGIGGTSLLGVDASGNLTAAGLVKGATASFSGTATLGGGGTSVTKGANDNSTNIATDAYVDRMNGNTASLSAAAITVPAAGTAPTGATAITQPFTTITACPTNGAVQLPAGSAASLSNQYLVDNRTTTACLVYPPSGGTLGNNAANVPSYLPPGHTVNFRSQSASAYFGFTAPHRNYIIPNVVVTVPALGASSTTNITAVSGNSMVLAGDVCSAGAVSTTTLPNGLMLGGVANTGTAGQIIMRAANVQTIATTAANSVTVTFSCEGP